MVIIECIEINFGCLYMQAMMIFVFFRGRRGGEGGGGISINVDSIVHAEMGVRCHFSREKLPPH